MSTPPPIYQVSELVNEMRCLMEASYPEIWIEGELSSLSAPASGHLYFTLKDEQSQIRCAMFRNRAAISKYQPVAGNLVRVRAKISVYAARGDLQCIVQHIEEAGEGLMLRQFEELKTKLNAQGLFDSEHKQPVPDFPHHIALITSRSGAAIHDVLTTLNRRAPGIPITLYPALVQGDIAATSIVQALNAAIRHRRADVILLCRGGGSPEDLWCFNDESLAQAIFDCPLPVVAGIGHEVDITIADLVADQRAPTPTAAAELLSPDRSQLDKHLRSLAARLPRSLLRNLQRMGQTVDLSFSQLVHPKQRIKRRLSALGQHSARLKLAMQNQLEFGAHEIKQYGYRLTAQKPSRRIEHATERLESLGNRFIRAKNQQLHNTEKRLAALGGQLQLVSPLATLGRGFSITRDKHANILREVSGLKPADKIDVQLQTGSVECEVLQVNP